MLKIGIIGAGGMAAYHIPGFRAGGAKVVALADASRAAADRAAEQYGIPHADGDVAEMLRTEPLDAVS